MQEPENILRILRGTKEAIRDEDVVKLKDLSNQTIHSASVAQDTNSILIAVIVYSLSKILERTNYKQYPEYKKFFKHLTAHIDKAITAVKANNEIKLRDELNNIRKDISKLTGNFKRQVQNVFQRAKINKASRIYEHGISMEKTSKLLGITIWELAEYAGQTGIGDVDLGVTMPAKQRVKLAVDFFKK